MLGKKIVTIETIFALTLIIHFMVPFVSATDMKTANIGSGQKYMLSFNLEPGTSLVGSFTVSGGSGNDINFWITNPAGQVIYNLGGVSNGGSFDITAQQSGAYTLNFDNSFSWFSSKYVVISYDLSRPSPFNISTAMDPMIITLIVVILVLLIGLVFAVYKMRKSKSKTETKK